MGHNQWRNFLFFQAIVVQICAPRSGASGALPRPSISLKLPNGTLVNSGLAEIPRGSRFVISCSVDSSLNSIHFFLSHNGTRLNTFHNSASFNFSVADNKHEGNYSCMYEVQLNGTYRSNETEWIHVRVTDPWWKMLFYILPVGILVLLLVVLLVICLVCRRRRRAEMPSSVVLNQITVSNSYADDDNEEEDEMDYVNVEPVDSKYPRAEEVDEVDSDSHDYEEPKGPAEGNTEEGSEEEESSDDEHDYVNLVEQTGEICREVDIYQNF